MNKKIIYLIGAIAGVAAVSFLTSQNSEVSPATEIKTEALPMNGLVNSTASTTAAVTDAVNAATPTPAAGTEVAPLPENTGMPAAGDELPAGAEVAPGQPDANTTDMEEMNDEKTIPPSEGQ